MSCLKSSPALTKHGSDQSPVVDGLVHPGLAAVADREVRPVERAGPGVLAGERDRRDALVLERLDRRQELGPRRRRRRDAGVLEGLRVVPEADEAEVERDAVVLAVDLVHAERAGVDLVLPRRDVRGDVLDEAGLDLLAESAAAPRLEQVGHVALLHQRGQLGLERLVLVDLDVDLDVRVRRHVLVGEGLPQAEARVVVLDVVPGDGDGLGGLRLGRGRRRGRRRLARRRGRGGTAGTRTNHEHRCRRQRGDPSSGHRHLSSLLHVAWFEWLRDLPGGRPTVECPPRRRRVPMGWRASQGAGQHGRTAEHQVVGSSSSNCPESCEYATACFGSGTLGTLVSEASSLASDLS